MSMSICRASGGDIAGEIVAVGPGVLSVKEEVQKWSFSDAAKTLGRPEQIYLETLSSAFVQMLMTTYPESWPAL